MAQCCATGHACTARDTSTAQISIDVAPANSSSSSATCNRGRDQRRDVAAEARARIHPAVPEECQYMRRSRSRWAGVGKCPEWGYWSYAERQLPPLLNVPFEPNSQPRTTAAASAGPTATSAAGGRTLAGRPSASPALPGRSGRYSASLPLPSGPDSHGRKHPQCPRVTDRRALPDRRRERRPMQFARS
jgi:hypothetical protein